MPREDQPHEMGRAGEVGGRGQELRRRRAPVGGDTGEAVPEHQPVRETEHRDALREPSRAAGVGDVVEQVEAAEDGGRGRDGRVDHEQDEVVGDAPVPEHECAGKRGRRVPQGGVQGRRHRLHPIRAGPTSGSASATSSTARAASGRPSDHSRLPAR